MHSLRNSARLDITKDADLGRKTTNQTNKPSFQRHEWVKMCARWKPGLNKSICIRRWKSSPLAEKGPWSSKYYILPEHNFATRRWTSFIVYGFCAPHFEFNQSLGGAKLEYHREEWYTWPTPVLYLYRAKYYLRPILLTFLYDLVILLNEVYSVVKIRNALVLLRSHIGWAQI